VKRLGLAAVILGIFASQHGRAFAEDAPAKWVFRELKNDRRIAHVEMRGTGPSGPIEATLVLSRDAANAGMKPVTKAGATTPPVIVDLCLHNAKQAAPFHLDDFEGPDAPANRSKLAKVSLPGDGKPWSRSWATSGWYSNLSTVLNPFEITSPDKKSAEPSAFVFGLGDPIRGYRDLLDFVEKLGSARGSLAIQISSVSDHSSLRFSVPLSGASEAVKRLMAPK